MAFPRSLDTKAMGEYVTRHFAWDRRGVAFPQSPLPKDFQALCQSFELAVAEEAVEYYEFPELPQVIFYVMPLNEAKRLGVLQGQALRSLELALIKLRWSSFESWVWLYHDRIFEARFRPKVGSRESLGTGRQEKGLEVFIFLVEVVLVYNVERPIDTPVFPCYYGVPSYLQHEGGGQLYEGILHLALEERFASASPPSQRLPCLMSALFVAKGAAANFELLEIVQATFYTTLLNEAIELGVAHDFTTKSMKSSLVGLRWSTFEVWMDYVDQVLRATQLQRPVDEVEVRGPLNDQEGGSGSNGPPAPSSDEE
ncbi:LOW QUALITY PROTEIN: hypothetical protein Cgig2_008309 [Carnegiea gigantea]|uniref:Uncharacterized protein n=1 Tax=Carnegiea gigantea TaxID=171969 RepID=A0A9Q1JTC4_9CARY|nr:LOW QUALITY PROTEIN: hypothetical protein Cgig2_008309 [Carnegiea gigantea]